MDIILLAIIGITTLIIVIIVFLYNSLIALHKRVDNAWAQIDVQLKRRTDLIPNLIETVKGYARFERKVLNEVTNARTAILDAKGPKELARADSLLTDALKSLFAVAENYPALKASENFLKLQEEFTATENKIAYARQFYNDIAMELNTAIEQFPTNIVASMFGLKKPREYYAVEAEEKKPIKADFSDIA